MVATNSWDLTVLAARDLIVLLSDASLLELWPEAQRSAVQRPLSDAKCGLLLRRAGEKLACAVQNGTHYAGSSGASR